MDRRIPPATNWKVALMKRENPAMPTARIAQECGVSAHSVRNILWRVQENADDPLPPRNQPRPGARRITAAQQQALVNYSELHPFATAKQLKEHFGLTCSATTVMRSLRERGIRGQRPARNRTHRGAQSQSPSLRPSQHGPRLGPRHLYRRMHHIHSAAVGHHVGAPSTRDPP